MYLYVHVLYIELLKLFKYMYVKIANFSTCICMYMYIKLLKFFKFTRVILCDVFVRDTRIYHSETKALNCVCTLVVLIPCIIKGF